MTKKPILITVAVGLFPVILWFASFGFESFSQPLSYLSKLMALAGFSLYGWNVILSSRHPLLVKAYGGLLSFYRWHQITGNLAFILLIIHPTMVVLRYANASLVSAYEFLKPTLDIPKMAGVLTLLILLTGVFISLYFTIKHELFIKVHIIMGSFLFVGAYHALFMSGSDVKQSLPITIYGTLIVLATGVIVLYRSIFKKSFAPSAVYEATSVKISGDIVRLSLQPITSKLQAGAGQFAFIKPLSGVLPKQSHPFSLISSAGSSQLNFAIKKVGDFSDLASEIRLGDKFMVEGPYGEFAKDINHYEHQIWVAGGIGVTPFLSMAAGLKNQKVEMFYSVRSESDLYFEKELVDFSRLLTGLKVEVNISEADGLLSIDTVYSSYCEGLTGIWICGPPKMVKVFKQKLIKKGVNKQDIFTEEFSL